MATCSVCGKFYLIDGKNNKCQSCNKKQFEIHLNEAKKKVQLQNKYDRLIEKQQRLLTQQETPNYSDSLRNIVKAIDNEIEKYNVTMKKRQQLHVFYDQNIDDLLAYIDSQFMGGTQEEKEMARKHVKTHNQFRAALAEQFYISALEKLKKPIKEQLEEFEKASQRFKR